MILIMMNNLDTAKEIFIETSYPEPQHYFYRVPRPLSYLGKIRISAGKIAPILEEQNKVKMDNPEPSMI